MQDGEGERNNLESALKGLVKLIKAVRYYPPAHPSLGAAVEEARLGFAPLLDAEPFSFLVRREGFALGETPVGADNPILRKLAPFLFSRRIQRLTVLPDLSGQDLKTFSRCLTLEPAEIQRLGGIQEVLQKALVSTLWANEVDLAKILARKEELDARKKARAGKESSEELFPGAQPQGTGKGAETAAAQEERDLRRVLQELERVESDQRYRLLLQELIPLVHLTLTETGRPLVLQALARLCRDSGDQRLSPNRRESAREALDQLSSNDVLDFLVAFLCTREIRKETRESILRLLVFLREKVVRRLMDHLAEESDAQARRFLTEALVRLGPQATAILPGYLADERWYVVRNAVAILGELRARDTAVHLIPLLHHPDVRVRRETIRTLTRIGGTEAVEILLRTVEEGDPELRPQALLSLGAMKDPAAVPTLLKLVGRPDPLVKIPEVKKEAIKALGEIGAPAAVPVLISTLKRRPLWGRARFNEVRAAAAGALGSIGGAEAATALEAATDDRAAPVARAAAQALKQLRKSEDHGAGTH